MDNECIFCKIAKGEIKTEVVYEDAEILAFKDVNPQAPFHVLFIPKKHIPTLNDVEESDSGLLGRILMKVKEAAVQNGIAEEGYRTVINCNKDAGQEVFHIHVHLLGGRKFNWPPG